MKRFVLVLSILMMVSCVLFAQAAQESQFPDPEKTFTIVVGFSAGGGTDLIFREFAECLKEVSGANFIISNIPGGSSATGTNELLNGEADSAGLYCGIELGSVRDLRQEGQSLQFICRTSEGCKGQSWKDRSRKCRTDWSHRRGIDWNQS